MKHGKFMMKGNCVSLFNENHNQKAKGSDDLRFDLGLNWFPKKRIVVSLRYRLLTLKGFFIVKMQCFMD